MTAIFRTALVSAAAFQARHPQPRDLAFPIRPSTVVHRSGRLQLRAKGADFEPRPRGAVGPALPGRVPQVDPHGPLSHRGRPIQFGAEKERDLRKLPPGDTLAFTALELRAGAWSVPPEPGNAWSELDDAGKGRLLLEAIRRRSKPKIKVLPGADYQGVAIEPNGWIEVISPPFGAIGAIGAIRAIRAIRAQGGAGSAAGEGASLRAFLDRYGWGHVHVTFIRGDSPEVRAAQVVWLRNANLYLWLSGLERGAGKQGEPCWRFAIKGLSVPTERHLDLAADMLAGTTAAATPFSKHLHVALRTSHKYGERDRIGFELRGGIQPEKERVFDSLLDGLVHGAWTLSGGNEGQDELRLTTGPASPRAQPRGVPVEVAALIDGHLEAHPVPGVPAGSGARLLDLLSAARFAEDAVEPPARLLAFDHRIVTPLLNYEALPWLTEDERTRVVAARSAFIEGLGRLAEDSVRRSPRGLATAIAIAELAVDWARRAQLAEVFGRWLDKEERVHFFSPETCLVRDTRTAERATSRPPTIEPTGPISGETAEGPGR